MSLKKRERRVPVNGRVDVKTYPALTFEQALDYVIAAKKSEGVRERTLDDYRKHYGYFVDWLTEFYPTVTDVAEITTQMIRDYVNYMRYDKQRYSGHKFINAESQRVGLSDTTVNIRLRTLKAIFGQLQRDNVMESNPLEPVKLIRQDVDLTNCLTDDEVKAILAQTNQRDFVGYRDYVAIVLLLDSGLRINELLSLRVSDVDFQTRFITLSGERNKNRKARMVPISVHAVKLLLSLISENREHFTTDRIFMSSFGEPLQPNHFNKRLKYYGEKAGVDGKKMTAHVYRHTWAKNMTLNGCDPFTLQKMGGWADIRTMRRYIQMDTSDVRESHDKFAPSAKFVKRRVGTNPK